jgi:predicted transcriptional regulator of viral defense system
MKALEVIEFARSRPLTTGNDISKKFNVSRSYALIFLERLFKKGVIERIEKGKYTCISDVIVIANHIIHPSYISFFTAASIKGYTEQIPRTIQLATTFHKKGITLHENVIQFIPLPQWNFYGYSKQRKDNFTTFIVDDEKLVIDILLRPKTVGNFEEIIEIIKNVKIEEKKMMEFSKRIKNFSLFKRLGYVLEKYKGIDISDILSIKDRNYISLNPFKKSGRYTDKKWRVKYD